MLRNIKDYQSATLPEQYIYISVAQQTLQLIDQQQVGFEVSIATGKNGVGEQFGSECTPRGWHSIRAKIGAGCPENTVFVGRRPTGEIWSEQLHQQQPQRDWILTRILWLSGQEVGFNRLGSRDTLRRFIYIHGCPENSPMGIADSHGCIRMRNAEIIQLFDRVDVGTPVFIEG